MKVSINLAQQYSNVDLKSIPSQEMLKRVGAQLGAIEETIDWSAKYKDVYVVKVVACEKHPNADKLSVCLIDDNKVVKNVERNKDGYVTVVCGAPNVKAGMFVAWLPPGSTVPVTRGSSNEFVLESRELRGVVSNGMLASAHELAINDDHSGLLEISGKSTGETLKGGNSLINYLGLDDFVIDCENKMFTHRPDCFGNLGVARELAGINGLIFKSPDWYIDATKHEVTSSLDLKVKNEIKDLVPRFMVQVFEGVKVAPSSIERQVTLARVGLRSVNNIVDLTNYYMHLTAQPTHAFDYDKIKKLSSGAPSLFPRLAKNGEELVLLNGKTIKLTDKDIVIATDIKAVALAGVMGGAETEVDDNTKNIIVECATFDMYTIRRTSMRHGLFTDAVTRFNKGQSPLQNDKVLGIIASDLSKMGAKIGPVHDAIDPSINKPRSVDVNVDFINLRLGKNFSPDEIADILSRTEIVVDIDGENLKINTPFWRQDIKIPEDIVEEVGRLYGFSDLPIKLPPRSTKPAQVNKTVLLKRKLANHLASGGANEVLTYSFVHKEFLEKSGQNSKDAYELRNAISPDLHYYRLSLTPSLLSSIHQNIKSGNSEFALFEIGTVHNRKFGITDEKVPVERSVLALTYCVNNKLSRTKDGAPFYTALKYWDSLADHIGLSYKNVPLSENIDGVTYPYHEKRSALILDSKNSTIGVIGEFKSSVKSAFKLPDHSAGFEVFIDNLTEQLKPAGYQMPSRFPSTSQDITLELDSGQSYVAVKSCIDNYLDVSRRAHGYLTFVEPMDIYSSGDNKKRLTFRVTLAHHEKTLTTEETNSFIEGLAGLAESELKAKRI